MSVSRRSFLRRSTAVAATVPLCQHLAFDFCDASIDQKVDFSMGFPPGAIRLNRNENPFGPSPKAIEAATQGLKGANRYAEPIQLRTLLAELHGVEEAKILIGTGSEELLRLAPLVTLRKGGNMVSTFETFPATPKYAGRLGAPIRWANLLPDLSYDTKGLLDAVDSETKLFYLVNPNNPSGSALSYDQVASIARALPKDVLFLIDEAYYHFLPGDGRSGIDLVKAGHPNVLVTRTFSKVHGLAGLRVGYGVGHPDIMGKLADFGCGPTSTNMAGFGAAVAALEDHDHVNKFLQHIRRSKAFFQKEFSKLGLKSTLADTPFFVVEIGDNANEIQEKLVEKNVFVRKGEDWHLPRHLRVSYGLDDENRAFIAALTKLLA